MWWLQAYMSTPLRYHATLFAGCHLCTAPHPSCKLGCAQFSATEDFGVYPNSRVSQHSLSLWPVIK